VHLSGLIAALSPETSRFCLEIARAAKKHGTRISFDLNHRASFWEGREQELKKIFPEIASISDILIGNEEDFQLCLGIEGPEAGGKDLAAKIDGFQGMIDRVKSAFPGVSVYATTLRQVISANLHMWGAIISEEDNWHVVEPREIHVYDRIGGGDGFVGGMLYAILKGWEAEKWLQFGWASGALVTTLETDYAQPADEEQIWSIWQGNARVKR
jgi:2-dehydro-3-deoxygluconokinase